jgi:TonB-linked SusC/RagA family outer membrane protein
VSPQHHPELNFFYNLLIVKIMKNKLLRIIIMSIKFSLTGFLLTCLFLQSLLAIDTKAQEIKSVKEVRVKLSFDQVSLIEAFQRIEKATNFIFIFNDHEIDKNLRISTSTRRDETLSDLLLEISRQAKVQFKQVNRNISVKKIAPDEQIQNNIEVIIQTRNVTGKVIAQEDREGLPGVNVIEKGTNNGTVTDVMGVYSLDVNEGATLVFSSVGYSTSEVVVGNRTVVDLVMTLDIRQLEELVVVGYGEQKRINLTGAVDQVTPEDIQNRPIQNLTQGLMGLMPNVNINMIEGKPIHAPAINIRGATSIGAGGDALVLIDGVEGDISMLNPNDIESISVLKDASAAAVYGARGAFGVVLVTTKKPARNKLTVNYTGSAGINQPTVNQSQYVTDGLTWANMFVDAFVNWEGTFPQNSNKTLPFSQDYLAELERRTNDPSLPRTDVDQDGYYRYYHSTDWYGHLFKSQTFTTDHNISASGSSDNVSFMVSGRALNQDGLIRLNPDDYQLLNLRAKGIIDLTNWLQVHSNLDFSNRTYFNPQNCCDAQFAQLDIALEGFPLAPLYNPDGTLTHSGAYALGGYAQRHNGIDLDRNVLRSTTGIEARFLQNKVRVVGDFSFQRTQEEIEQKRVPVSYSRSPGLIESIGNELNWLRVTTNANNFLATNFYVEYHDVFNNKHDLRAVVGTNYEESTFRSLAVRRDGLIFPGATNLALALGQDIATSASYNKWAILGSFYRLNYIFDNRYLFELTGRYDGSSKFPENERYAFFPSASAGWRISSEPFWRVNENFISHLQLRASYGSMGNGNIPAYRFHQTFGISQSGRILDGTRPQFTRNPAVLPDGLTWETVTTSNFGINLGMLKNRLEFSGDMYIRETTDMFTIALTPPATFGASPPMGNYADLNTRGWESMISWRDNLEIANRPFSYNIRFFMADHKAKVTRFNNPDKFLNNYYEGMIIGEIWGYETEGFFTSEEDIKNHASQSRFRSTSWGQFYPGDIKLRDLDGDGQIGPGSNTADNPGDRRIIGNSTPRYTYGIRLGTEWNGIFLSTFFQGVGRRDWFPSAEANFWGQYNRPYNQIPKWHLNDGIIWSEDNPNSFFPRYVSRLASSGNAMLRQTQTKYLLDASYLRLKNLQVGYHLPQGITSRLGMSAASVYFSGENLLSWSPLYKIADNQDVENLIAQSDEMARPNETIRQGYNYPMMRSLTIGLSLTF